ncbi:GNAT family N-acetyltransferase [Sphingomonas rhizophila]|uniref:GNAT family N-acetyltransferase n=2 Tax=Sphingomonas rhizophila TaxID=2071607 RepID=A0A7G9SE76_9SPHN|nr:GNAT family N-acetyltransferase [Sphingomonas rhizophila]
MVHEGELDRDDVRALLTFHFKQMRAGSPRDACHVLDLDSLRDPAIRFFSLREADRLLGIGALKTLDATHGELKSMRTEPEALGRGVGGRMLAHLIETAQEMGLTRLSLETGNTELFAAANRLYERDGFEHCAPFGDYKPTPFTHFYTRTI